MYISWSLVGYVLILLGRVVLVDLAPTEWLTIMIKCGYILMMFGAHLPRIRLSRLVQTVILVMFVYSLTTHVSAGVIPRLFAAELKAFLI